ncbi:hypothetical protein [Mesorhizobium caraganae]|uniref:hypothetical protein n=1 Tax=Mesorhizobium caraganae TaxID=483206 RepID=UPI003ECC6C8C
MDAATGPGLSQKALEVVRSLPFWLLIAVSIVLAAIWWSPALSMPLPAEVNIWIPLAAFSFIVLSLVSALAWIASALKASRTRWRTRDLQRFTKIYRPLYALFLTHHVTTYQSTGYPKLRDRVGHAWEEFNYYRYWPARIRKAYRALSDRKISVSAEVEFGGGFPLREIHAIVNDNIELADKELLGFLRRADRSCYEDDRRGDSLTDEQFELFAHTMQQHDLLEMRVGL